MQDQYTDSSARYHEERAHFHAKCMDSETNGEWSEAPLRCDIWRLHTFLADLHESHAKMIHGNTLVKEYHDNEMEEKLKPLNDWFQEVTEEWFDKKYEVEGVLNTLNLQLNKEMQEKNKKKKHIKQMKKSAYLYLQGK